MKKLLLSILFLVIGTLIIASCSDEKVGESPGEITEKIELDSEDQIMDSIVSDTIRKDESMLIPPIPVSQRLVLPRPEPIPEPEPEPISWPIEPYPIPEPLPRPIPIVDFADVEAVYPGGIQAMIKFISDNVNYPEIDKELGVQGRVYVQFVIEKDGSMSQIQVMRGVSATIDQEAKRVFSLMPKWKPAESGGKIVRSRATFPINFMLD